MSVYAVYAISSLDTGSPLRHRTPCNAVGTPQGVAGLAPRPFTLGEETGSHHMVMYIAPACSSACTTGAHLCICRPIGGHLSSSSARAPACTRGARRATLLLPPTGVPSDPTADCHAATQPPRGGLCAVARPWPTPCRSPPEGGCIALYDVWRVWLYGCIGCMRCIA